ncbi:MAG: KEOPS complex subunit Cgi121 [Candidatus Bathyarchaeia archaeon]
MKETEIHGYHIVIAGFKNVKVDHINSFLGLIKKGIGGSQVQFFDAMFIAGFDHLFFSLLNAFKAFETGLNRSKNLAVEALLFASGQHQIKKALEILGIKRDTNKIVVLIIAETRLKAVKSLDYISKIVAGEPADDVIELTDEKMEIIKKAFGITNLELEATLRKTEKEALTSLLIEHAALSITQR